MRPVGRERPNHAETPTAFLREYIAREGGAIPVERFMQAALYHPRYGYYSRRVRTVGRRGDFSTSATLHGALGRAVAAWAAHHRGTWAGRWHLIELGGGSGELAAEIIRSSGWWARAGLHYHLVEVSDTLREEQRRRLEGCRNVRWHADVRSALEAAGGRALVFSNEFADAFPCAQLARGDAEGSWREVCVAWPEPAEFPVETLRAWEPPSGDGSAMASALDPARRHPPGQRVEVHYAYQRWLAEWLPHWKEGRLLTIDYGDTVSALYHRQPHGTLRAYCHHPRLTGPEVYRRFGQQDLTADVNFTDLRAWGEALGLRTRRYETQADFLRRWLPRRALARADHDPVLARLLDPAGAGGAFKVLDQTRPRRQNAA